MRFKTLSEYDEEIKRIEEILDNFKEYINNYSQEMSIKPTYISGNMFVDALIVNHVRLSVNKTQYGLLIQNGWNYNENKT